MAKILAVATHGTDDPTKSTFAFGLEPGIYNTLKTLDSRLRTAGMTD